MDGIFALDAKKTKNQSDQNNLSRALRSRHSAGEFGVLDSIFHFADEVPCEPAAFWT